MTKLSNQPFLAVAGGVFAVVLSGVASAAVSGATESTSSSSFPTFGTPTSGASGTPSTSSSFPSFMGAGGASSMVSGSPSNSSAVPSASSKGLTETVATQLISTTSLQQMLTISNAIGSRSGVFQAPPGARANVGSLYGMAAGGASPMWNTWGSISGSSDEYKSLSLDTTNTVLGADYAVTPAMAVGASVAFDRSSGSLFNTTTTGYTVAPYLGWQINKDWSLDGTIGWGKGDMNFGATSVKPDRFFYGANVTYTNWYGNWQVSGKGSYLYGEEKYESATLGLNNKNKIDQWRLGGQVGYWMDGVLPYFGLAYSTDSQKTATTGSDDLGKDGWLCSLGVNFISLKSNLTGGVVFNSESGRSNSKRESLMANINYRF